MARINLDSTSSPIPAVATAAAPAPTRAELERYDHGHGHGHARARATAAAAAVVDQTPVTLRVTLVSAVDEHADQPVAVALRVHDEKRALRPSLFPPRRGQRLPQTGLPSTSALRLSMIREHIDAHRAAQALSILAK